MTAIGGRSRTGGVCAVFARADGSVLDLPDATAAVDGGWTTEADPRDFIPLPAGTLLLTLPRRSPVVIDEDGARSVVDEIDGAPVHAAAAALPLGYTRTMLPAYEAQPGAPPLPLYGYTAVVWSGDALRVAAVKTDELESWNAAAHGPDAVRSGIERLRREFVGNAMLAQLEICATDHGCYTAQNVFLRAGEGALPVSPACNARCIGCISEQEPESGVAAAQARLRAAPSVRDIAVVAAAHLEGVGDDGIVSFGQGCEGEPLLAAPRIAAAIRAIRARTRAGLIHCNTNASRPASLADLLDAGLSSVRVSLNACRPAVHAAYYRPRGYGFDDVRESLRIAGDRGAAISLNLLTHPGVTDDPDEMEAFAALLRETHVAMVQTRTLNVDPQGYFAAVGRPRRRPVGMRAWLEWLRREFPRIRVGNFTRGYG